MLLEARALLQQKIRDALTFIVAHHERSTFRQSVQFTAEDGSSQVITVIAGPGAVSITSTGYGGALEIKEWCDKQLLATAEEAAKWIAQITDALPQRAQLLAAAADKIDLALQAKGSKSG